MTSVEEASELPMLRPLLTWDKREVMAKAAALGILSLSELPAEDACPLFAGAKQRTAVPRADILEAEAQLDLDELARSAAQGARKVEPGVYPGQAATGVARGLNRRLRSRRLRAWRRLRGLLQVGS